MTEEGGVWAFAADKGQPLSSPLGLYTRGADQDQSTPWVRRAVVWPPRGVVGDVRTNNLTLPFISCIVPSYAIATQTRRDLQLWVCGALFQTSSELTVWRQTAYSNHPYCRHHLYRAV